MNTLTITETKLLVPVSKLDNEHPWSYLQTTQFTHFWHDVWQKQTHWPNLNMFLLLLLVCVFSTQKSLGGTPYNSLYGEVLPKRGTFFRLQVYERVGISQVEVYEMVGESVISVFEKTQKG